MSDDELDGYTDEQLEKMAGDFEAADRRKQKWAGVPHRYEWWSPVGKFQIVLNTFHAGPVPWELFLGDKRLKGFADPQAAMVAVYTRETGHDPWDRYKGSVMMPSEEKDWTT